MVDVRRHEPRGSNESLVSSRRRQSSRAEARQARRSLSTFSSILAALLAWSLHRAARDIASLSVCRQGAVGRAMC